jgi:hypothetical protein
MRNISNGYFEAVIKTYEFRLDMRCFRMETLWK